MPVQDARIIASAIPATNPSNLSAALILGCALGIGVLGGILTALLRDRFDPTVRNEQDAESATGLRVLATLDEIEPPGIKRRNITDGFKPFGRATEKRLPSVAHATRLLTYAIDQPFSSFAENFRHLRLVLNRYTRGGAKVIGIITASPGEGKTTVACNLAHHYAASGSRTILIDCDLRNPQLTDQLCPSDVQGLPDVLMGNLAWQAAIRVDPDTKLSLLTGRSSIAMHNPSELLAQSVFDDLLEKLSESYDVVIIDLAPIGPVADAFVVARLVDMFVLVLASDRAIKEDVRQILEHAPEIYEKIAGVVLNRVQDKRTRKTYPAKGARAI